MESGQPDEIPSMISDYHFECGGRTYPAKKYSANFRFKRRPKPSSHKQTEDGLQGEVLVLYNPSKPTRNVILSGALAETINDSRSLTDHMIHCAPAIIAVGVLIVLFRGAELF